MQCLVLVKFLPEGSLSPEEFFTRINARWSWLENTDDSELGKARVFGTDARSPKSAICIADYESIEQLAIDLTIMPGAGISNVEVVPIFKERVNGHSVGDLLITGPSEGRHEQR